jgi:presenilin-like A22 family membrane protease
MLAPSLLYSEPPLQSITPPPPHFNYILVCVTQFLVTIHFSKKCHSLELLAHLLVAQNICKAFFINATIMGEILE